MKQSGLSYGHLIDSEDIPFQDALSNDCIIGAAMSAVCDQEIVDLLRKKAIVSIPKPMDGYVSNMFAVKKRSNDNEP